MGIGTRVYYVGDDETLIRMPVSGYFDLVLRRSKEPDLEFAGKMIYFAVAYYRIKCRRPNELIKIDYTKTLFDKRGFLDEEAFNEGMRLALNCMAHVRGEARNSNTAVIDGQLHFAQRSYRSHNYWTPPEGLEDAILEDLFGDTPTPRS